MLWLVLKLRAGRPSWGGSFATLENIPLILSPSSGASEARMRFAIPRLVQQIS